MYENRSRMSGAALTAVIGYDIPGKDNETEFREERHRSGRRERKINLVLDRLIDNGG